MSCTCPYTWQPRIRGEARCNVTSHHQAIPVTECSCGFYAYKTEGGVATSGYFDPGDGLSVAGRVALWGKVIEHETGFRAVFAYPQLLYLRGQAADELVRCVADRYAIECVPGTSDIPTN